MDGLKRYYEFFPELWEGYVPGEVLGRGSFGDVYELRRRGTNEACVEAMKEVVVPPVSMGGLDEAFFQGLDMEGVKYYYEGMKAKALSEVEILKRFSNCPNIIRIHDYMLKELPESSGEYGWVLFVRMELLEDFKSKLLKERMTISEAADLLLDLCTALEACKEEGIFHRDIKPENIFYSRVEGKYKLGDFGIACYMSRATEEKGLPGTLTHMTPEVYQGGKFDYGADLYAVGMVLYKLLNENRVAFLPDYPEKYSPGMRNQAIRRRLEGEEVLLPSIVRNYKNNLVFDIGNEEYDAVKEFAEIATKMVSAKRSDRYASATEVKKVVYNWKEKHKRYWSLRHA